MLILVYNKYITYIGNVKEIDRDNFGHEHERSILGLETILRRAQNPNRPLALRPKKPHPSTPISTQILFSNLT